MKGASLCLDEVEFRQKKGLTIHEPDVPFYKERDSWDISTSPSSGQISVAGVSIE